MQYLSAPPNLSRKHLLTVFTVAMALALLSALTLDQRLAQFFKSPEMASVWLFAREITNVGLSVHYFVASILVYTITRFWLHRFTELRRWARDFFFALVGSGLFLHVVKFIVGRQRPHLSVDAAPYEFQPFTMDWDFQSFPSGHSQVMFTVATMMSLGFPKARWFFFALAAFFSFTRVMTHDHFLSDVIAGGMVGYIGTTLTVFWLHDWLLTRSKS